MDDRRREKIIIKLIFQKITFDKKKILITAAACIKSNLVCVDFQILNICLKIDKSGKKQITRQ